MKYVLPFFLALFLATSLSSCSDIDGFPPAVLVHNPSDGDAFAPGDTIFVRATAQDNNRINRTQIRLFKSDGESEDIINALDIDNPGRSDLVELDTFLTVPNDVTLSTDLTTEFYLLGFRAWDGNNFSGVTVLIDILAPSDIDDDDEDENGDENGDENDE